MSAGISIIPTKAAVESAWDRYSGLVTQAKANGALWADRQHIEATFKAHEEFRRAFLAMEGANA